MRHLKRDSACEALLPFAQNFTTHMHEGLVFVRQRSKSNAALFCGANRLVKRVKPGSNILRLSALAARPRMQGPTRQSQNPSRNGSLASSKCHHFVGTKTRSCAKPLSARHAAPLSQDRRHQCKKPEGCEVVSPRRHQGGPRKTSWGWQNSFAAATTALLTISWRSGESILISSSRLMMEPASRRTAGIRVNLRTTSWS